MRDFIGLGSGFLSTKVWIRIRPGNLFSDPKLKTLVMNTKQLRVRGVNVNLLMDYRQTGACSGLTSWGGGGGGDRDRDKDRRGLKLTS